MSLKLEKQLEKINPNSYIENDRVYEQSNLKGTHIYPVHKAQTNNKLVTHWWLSRWFINVS